MAKYELTVDDVAPVKSLAKGKAPTRSPKVKGGKPAKYMDPKTGKTWTGHGKAPAWIAVATKKGRRDDFLIQNVTQVNDAKPAETGARQAPVIAPKSSGTPKKAVTKKVASKKPKAVAKKVPVAKRSAPSSKKPAPAKKANPAAPAKKAPKNVAGNTLATQPKSAAATLPTVS